MFLYSVWLLSATTILCMVGSVNTFEYTTLITGPGSGPPPPRPSAGPCSQTESGRGWRRSWLKNVRYWRRSSLHWQCRVWVLSRTVGVQCLPQISLSEESPAPQGFKFKLMHGSNLLCIYILLENCVSTGNSKLPLWVELLSMWLWIWKALLGVSQASDPGDDGPHLPPVWPCRGEKLQVNFGVLLLWHQLGLSWRPLSVPARHDDIKSFQYFCGQ